MPYRYVEPDEFITHQGVTIWHAYRDGTDEPHTYWFTTKPEQADGGGDGWFDARRLTGLWSDTPTIAQWEGWWSPRYRVEDEAIEALIRTGIEEGRINAP